MSVIISSLDDVSVPLRGFINRKRRLIVFPLVSFGFQSPCGDLLIGNQRKHDNGNGLSGFSPLAGIY